MTTPGGRQPHSANSERKWFDSFVSRHLWIYLLKYLKIVTEGLIKVELNLFALSFLVRVIAAVSKHKSGVNISI